jgi:hypothetical protein
MVGRLCGSSEIAAEWTEWVTPSEAVDSHGDDDFVPITRLRRSAWPGQVDRCWAVPMVAQPPGPDSGFAVSEFENASGIPDRRHMYPLPAP